KNISPTLLGDHGFEFLYPDISQAIEAEIK
ncbi:uncharacterized protein METZ01_LOCUS390440, partial [marine metagenome]